MEFFKPRELDAAGALSTAGAESDLRPRPAFLVRSPTKAVTQVRGGLSPHVMRLVREHIETNIDHQIRVATLAKLANLSVSYFLRAFKRPLVSRRATI